MCSSWCRRRITRPSWRRWTPTAARLPEFRFELARRAFAHTGQLRHRDCLDARGSHGRATAAFTREPGHGAACAGPPRNRRPQAERPALRREPAPARGLVRARSRRRPRRAGHPAGQGALVHQPARPRRGGAHRGRVRRAGGGRHQAHQPVRRGDGRHHCRSLRPGARGGRAGGVRRHHRPQSSGRRRHGQGDRVDVHRGGDCPGGGRGGPAHPGRQAEPARGRRPPSRRWPVRTHRRRSGARSARCSARCSCRSATR